MHKKSTIHKKIKKVVKNKTALVSVSFLCFVAVLGVFLMPSLSGQLADSFLRGMIGEKQTIQLESVYFGFQDKVNAIDYKVTGQAVPVFPSLVPLQAPEENSDQMELTRLNQMSELPPLSGEGQWVVIPQTLFPQDVVIARTFLRPDTTHPYAIVSLVKMDMKKLGVGIQAGTYYPGGTHGVYGPGIIPKQIQESGVLLAAFNGGFQEKDGHYGMVVGSKVYVSLRRDIPALLLYKDGSVQFVDKIDSVPSDAVAVRQNGPYLIKNSVITPFVEMGTDTWGRTTTNSMYTWRSGIGVTKNGNLVYAAGNSVVPQTLAQALLAAGAQTAIQLDVNPPWVRFILYASKGNGKYSFTPLLDSMQGGAQYLQGYNKDFFYVYKK